MPRWFLAVILISGCGFALNGPDPERPRGQVPRCDTSKGAVVVDGIMATLAGVIAISVAGTSEPAVALIPAGIGAIYLGGAIHGNRAVNECHAAMNDYEQMTAARGTLGNTPPPPVDEDEGEQPQRPMTRPLAPPGQQVMPQQPAPPTVAAQPPAPQGPAQQVAQQVPPQQPAQVQAPPAAPQTKKPPPPPKPTQDEWSDFWREVQ